MLHGFKCGLIDDGLVHALDLHASYTRYHPPFIGRIDHHLMKALLCQRSAFARGQSHSGDHAEHIVFRVAARA